MLVISDNIFSKYIENDNCKIELTLKKIIIIYNKFLKRQKLKYFLKYKTKTTNINVNVKRKNKNKKRNIMFKERNVHERLFDDSIIRQKMLDNLLSKYLIDEEGKYTFYPKINDKDVNYYIKNSYLYDYTDRNLWSGRKLRSKSFNKNYNLNYINDFTTSYFNKYIESLRTAKNRGLNSTSSFSCSNINFSDLNSLYDNNFNQNYRYMPINTKKKKLKKNSIPISTKYRNKLYNSLFIDENKEKDDMLKKTSFYKFNHNLNRTSSSFYPWIYNDNNNSLYNTSYKNNNSNRDYFNYLNNKTKKNSKNKQIQNNISQEYVIPQYNEKIFGKNKNIRHISNVSLNEESKGLNNCKISNSFNRNSNSSLYNISSIACSIKDDKNKIKNVSPEKKEHLFSFGSDLFFIDNNNPNNVNVINKSLIEKMQKKNNTAIKNDRKKNLLNSKIINRNNNRKDINNNTVRTQNNINSLTGNNHISTNYTGSYSIHTNNINGDINKNINKNSIEKNNRNKLEMQSINEYYILNNNNEGLKNEGLIFQTTIQTLSDSKIFDLANDCMSKDDSLESYRKKSVIYNKKHV